MSPAGRDDGSESSWSPSGKCKSADIGHKALCLISHGARVGTENEASRAVPLSPLGWSFTKQGVDVADTLMSRLRHSTSDSATESIDFQYFVREWQATCMVMHVEDLLNTELMYSSVLHLKY